jgi:predicted RNA-binding Zn-ribbon protein involved in translation (DUF1610 family)
MPIQGFTDYSTIAKRNLPIPVFAMVKKGAEKPERGVGKNLDHFRFDWSDLRAEKLFNELYGIDNQHELLIKVLGSEVDSVLDSSYRLYKQNGTLDRKCDGCTILRSMQGLEGKPCVCTPALRDSDDANERRGQCSPKAYFRFILPELCQALGYLGQFVLITGSKYEMRDMATVLFNVKESSGKLVGQPFLLRRVEVEYDTMRDGKPTKKKEFNVEIVPPLSLVLASADTPILGAPQSLNALPSGEDFEDVEEPEIEDMICSGCGQLVSYRAATTLLMECPDCGNEFVERPPVVEDSGKPKTKKFSANNETLEALTKFQEGCARFFGCSVEHFLGEESLDAFLEAHPNLDAIKAAVIERIIVNNMQIRVYGVKTETYGEDGIRYLLTFGFGSVYAYSRDDFEANTIFDAHGTYFDHVLHESRSINEIGNHSFQQTFKREYLLLALRWTEAKGSKEGGKLAIKAILDPEGAKLQESPEIAQEFPD